MDAKLVMFKSDGQRREFPLKKQTTTIGRNTDCDFQIPLPVVSRRHCQVTLDGEKLAMRDLGSSNGSFVNSKRVQEATLEAGDQLTIGPVIFTIVINGLPAEVTPVRTVIDGAVPAAEQVQEGGTVDVEAEAELEEVVEEEAPAADNPLAALQALNKKK